MHRKPLLFYRVTTRYRAVAMFRSLVHSAKLNRMEPFKF